MAYSDLNSSQFGGIFDDDYQDYRHAGSTQSIRPLQPSKLRRSQTSQGMARLKLKPRNILMRGARRKVILPSADESEDFTLAQNSQTGAESVQFGH